MPEHIDLNQAIGKTVKDAFRHSLDNEAFILFTDGTFTRLTVQRGYEDDYNLENYASDKPADYMNVTGVRLGFWTEETLTHAIAQKRTAERDREQRKRREQYEQLKQEFDR